MWNILPLATRTARPGDPFWGQTIRLQLVAAEGTINLPESLSGPLSCFCFGTELPLPTNCRIFPNCRKRGGDVVRYNFRPQ